MAHLVVNCYAQGWRHRVKAPVKIFFGPPRMAGQAKNLYTKSERLTLSCRLTWYNRQLLILTRKTKISRAPDTLPECRAPVICTGSPPHPTLSRRLLLKHYNSLMLHFTHKWCPILIKCAWHQHFRYIFHILWSSRIYIMRLCVLQLQQFFLKNLMLYGHAQHHRYTATWNTSENFLCTNRISNLTEIYCIFYCRAIQ